VLPGQIHYKFKGFDIDTLSTIDTDCELARGKPQWSGVLDWFSQSKHFDPIVVAD
jgi:hypothetical protein